MRICLLSTSYPPTTTEGIARQRQVLATELARRNHDVHVVTLGSAQRTRIEAGVTIHEGPAPHTTRYIPAYPTLDPLIAESHALYQGMLALTEFQFDIVDVPLWAGQGFASLRRCTAAGILWLQTSTMQLMAINGQRRGGDAERAISLERDALLHAAGILADSRVALNSVLHDYQIQPQVPLGIVHLGLPSAAPLPPRRISEQIEALVVGRLERRKGTPLLFEILPALLDRLPDLVVRFVGRDNSANDGWLQHHGVDYATFFRRQHPELGDRVIFEGYVPDTILEQRYAHADLLLAPSIYESFGLTYLEAMRAGLPVVTFAAGGAVEIFTDGKRHGAILVPPGDAVGLLNAIVRLAEAPQLRATLGAAGYARFGERFSVAAMATATLAFYEEVLQQRATRRIQQTIAHVMPALAPADAVSAIACTTATLLGELGETTAIVARHPAPELPVTMVPLEHVLQEPPHALIFHYWGFSEAAWIVSAIDGPKAIYYHNMTPHTFFPQSSTLYRLQQRGFSQLAQIADRFDLAIGDSRYNLAALATHRTRSLRGLQIYPIVEPAELQRAPYSHKLTQRLRESGETHFIFVGRLAPNKRQDRLMGLFDYYCRQIDPRARLWLIGDDQADPRYHSMLEQLRQQLPSGDRICMTGVVSRAELYAYYRAADLFICASEHEGFCIPIAEAMAFDVPVIAYGAAAVPETIGDGSVIIAEWDTARVAELAHLLITDTVLRDRVIAAQQQEFVRFSRDAARSRLAAVVAFLRSGVESPLFERFP